MNMAEKIPEEFGPIGNPAVIQLLEAALLEARTGRLCAVAVVKVPAPGKLDIAASGNQQTDLYTGAGLLQAVLLQAMQGGGGQRSSLLVPRR